MKTYFKLMVALYVVALLICGACRTYLRLYFIDDATGFYSGGDLFALIFNAALGFTIVIMFLSNRLKKADGDYPVYAKSKFVDILAIAAGVSIIAFAIIGPPDILLEQGRSEMFNNISKYLNMGLGVISGIGMIYLGSGGIFGRISTPIGIFAVLPSVWQVILLITRYNGYTTVTPISDHLLIVLFMTSNSLFLLGQARTICMQMRKDGRNYAIPAGFCASLCGFLLTVPNFVYQIAQRLSGGADLPDITDMLLNNADGISTPLIGLMELICIFVMSLYALAFTIGLVRSIKKV